MQYKIEPMRVLRGEITAPPSKSHSHRAFFLALGASSPSFLVNPLIEGDVAVTRDFCTACGATIEELPPDSPEYVPFSPSPKVYKIYPPSRSHKIPVLRIDGANSGTSIRLCTVLAPFFAEETFISGIFFKRHRPMDPLFDAIKPMGITVDHTDSPPGIHIYGSPQTPALITIPGDISSQFISSLLLAIPLLPQTSDQPLTTLELTTPSVSTGYLTLTEEFLQAFQIQFSKEKTVEGYQRYQIPVSQSYQGQIITIPGDYSSLAPLIAAAALNPYPDEIRIHGLTHPSSHPDATLLPILHQMQADWIIDEESYALVIRGGRELWGCNIDCQDIPDLFPILCVLGLFCNNFTRITHINRLEQKESPRVSIMLRELRKMGAIILRSTDGDEILIEGPQQIRGADLNHENDHRIAMALTIAALYARNASLMTHPLIVQDSYPSFFTDLHQIGVSFSEIESKEKK